MALIQCKECGANVSDQAFKCPTCGVTLRKPKRSFMGNLFKWSFIAFNILMAFWLFSYLGEVGGAVSKSTNEAYQAGAAIGGTIGTGIIGTFWLIGDVILGLFVLLTRPKQ